MKKCHGSGGLGSQPAPLQSTITKCDFILGIFIDRPADIAELLHELDLATDKVQLLHVGEILGHQGQLQGRSHACIRITVSEQLCCGSGSGSESVGFVCFWAWIRIRLRILLSLSKNIKKTLFCDFFLTFYL